MSQATAARTSDGDGRDRRWDDHRQARHELILSTAIAMIDAGDQDAGVAAIAARAGIPRSVVYRLFKDREDLDEQIRQRIVDDMAAEMTPVLVLRGTIRNRLRRVVSTYVQWVEAHAQLHRFLGAGSAAHPVRGSRAMLGGKAAFARMLEDLIEGMFGQLGARDALPAGLASNLAFGLFGMTDSVINHWLAAEPSERSRTKDLTRFLVEAASGQITAAAAMAGVEIDLDRRL